MSYIVYSNRMKLVVIIPALNEEKTIESVISRIPREIEKISEVSVVLVNDGGTDRTADIAESMGTIVVHHPVNMGVGAAFRTGIKAALSEGADIIVNIDADGQFNPHDIPKLIEPILNTGVQFVTATRFAAESETSKMPWVKLWGNKQMVRIVNTITRQNLTDVSCGFRAYTREAALKMTLFGSFTYTQETFIDLAFKRVSMTEVPMKVRGEREFGKSRVASNLWRYAVKSATIIFRAARDYLPQYFFGIPGLLIFILGMLGSLFLFVHYLQTGQTAPYRSLVTVSGVFIIVGFLLLFLSMLADMLHRNRIIAEEIVYLQRKQTYKK